MLIVEQRSCFSMLAQDSVTTYVRTYCGQGEVVMVAKTSGVAGIFSDWMNRARMRTTAKFFFLTWAVAGMKG